MVWRPSEANWYEFDVTGGSAVVPFGQSGDIPVRMVADGDGRKDLVVWRARRATRRFRTDGRFRVIDGHVFAGESSNRLAPVHGQTIGKIRGLAGRRWWPGRRKSGSRIDRVLMSTTGFIVSPSSRSLAAAPGRTALRSASGHPARAQRPPADGTLARSSTRQPRAPKASAYRTKSDPRSPPMTRDG